MMLVRKREDSCFVYTLYPGTFRVREPTAEVKCDFVITLSL
jgi:hypothetical protein